MIYAVAEQAVALLTSKNNHRNPYERVAPPTVRSEGYDALKWYLDCYRVSNLSGVVVLPLCGIMELEAMNYNWYGTTLIDALIAKAQTLDDVRAIVIKTDSPGGNANAWRSLANTIYASKKPVVAHVVSACSAAMPVVSVCDEIFIEPTTTAMMGSIGSVYIHRYDNDPETVVTIIRSKEDKFKPNSFEPIDDATRAALQAMTVLADKEMTLVIKKGRGGKVASEVYASAKVLYMEDALRLGLADKKGTLSDAIARADELANVKF